MNSTAEFHTDIPFWCSTVSSLLTFHSFKHSKVDSFIKTKLKFNNWCVSVWSKVRLCDILQSFILMISINASHRNLQLLTGLHLSYVVGSHFLICLQYMWWHMEGEVQTQLKSFDVSFCMWGIIWKNWCCPYDALWAFLNHSNV